MTDLTEPTLFDVSLPDTDAPRCRMCLRPAWRRSNGEYHAYCTSGSGCTNRERICQQCDGPFQVGVDGAGTKYCSTECKRVGYTAGHRGRSILAFTCAWCGEIGESSARRITSATVWPYVCRTCTDPIQHLVTRLKSHKVSHERARQLLDDPGCEVCGRDIVTKVRNGTTGRVAAPLVVDHDHGCCPGVHSCGRCVRGLLCGQCNMAAGSVGDDPERARALADYLERHG